MKPFVFSGLGFPTRNNGRRQYPNSDHPRRSNSRLAAPVEELSLPTSVVNDVRSPILVLAVDDDLAPHQPFKFEQVARPRQAQLESTTVMLKPRSLDVPWCTSPRSTPTESPTSPGPGRHAFQLERPSFMDLESAHIPVKARRKLVKKRVGIFAVRIGSVTGKGLSKPTSSGKGSWRSEHKRMGSRVGHTRRRSGSEHIRTRSKSSNLQIDSGSKSSDSLTLVESALAGGTSAKSSNEVPRQCEIIPGTFQPGPHNKVLSDKPNLFTTRHHPGALDLTSLLLMDPPPGPTTRIGPADKTGVGLDAHELTPAEKTPTGTLDLTFTATPGMTSDRRSYQPPIVPRVVLTRSRTAGGLASRKGRGLPPSPRNASQRPGELGAVSERPQVFPQELDGSERVEGVCRTLEPSEWTESGSRVTATGRAKETRWGPTPIRQRLLNLPRMLSRSSSALRGPPRPPPAHPVPATPDEEEVGTATTADDARVASHKPHPSISSRAPVQESNTRWAARSRSGSTASGNWRGSNMFEEDQDDYGLPSPSPPDPDGMMSHGEYGGIVGPRRDLYSDEELDSVTEENESLSDDEREDRTAAMIVADEGRGLIVDAEGRAVSDLDVQPGTTHLLLANNSSPAIIPGFLAQILPQISSTLLCLDISQNNLAALPPALSACTALEELNVSHNPLRSLPSSIGALVSLRVLIADGCDLTALPQLLVNLGALHSLSVRSNRLVMLPVWMCAMPSLEVLKIEGNAFAGPWRGVVEPLLPRDYSPQPSPLPNGTLASPIVLSGSPLPPSRPQRSYSAQPQPGVGWGSRPNTTHSLGSSSPNLGVYPTSASAPHSPPSRAGMLSPPPVPVMSPPSSAGAGSLNHMHSSPAASSLGHIHSSPGSSFNHLHSSPGSSLSHLHPAPPTPSTAAALNMHLGALAPRGKKTKKRGGGSISGSEIATDIESEVETSRATMSMTSPRRIKSSDELKRFGDSGGPPSAPILTHAPTLPEPQSQIKRYMSLGVRGSSNRGDARHAWSRYSGLAPTGEDEFGYAGSDDGRARSAEDGSNRLSGAESRFSGDPRFSGTDPRFSGMEERTRYSAGPDDDYVHSKQLVDAYAHKHLEDAYSHSKSAASSPEEQRRKGRWGFLKKVSMGRLRSHSNADRLGRMPRAEVGSMPGVPTGQLGLVTGPGPAGSMGLGSLPGMPRRNMPSAPMPLPSAPPPRVDVTTAGSPASSVLTARMLQTKASREALNGAPSPSLLPPTAPRSKRRSFLPFDTPPTLNIPIPSAEPFMPSVVALGTDDDEEMQRRTEEETARVQIALRGVMSYLRDMADLGGVGEGLVPNRRPPLTQYADGRTKSDGSYASSTSTPPMLRSAPSMASLRGGQDSVNTTDSSGSYGQGFSEDRKYKDDKGRRVAIVREIVETEKSYVKGLQELLDIYVKPSSEPAPGLNVSKETTIPAQERKIVFTGVDALLQFHKMSFLPSLIAAAEILSTGGEDTNGQVSTMAAHAVANVFVSHAAFMKMYFTYINNFDNALQRLQFWSAPPSAPNTPGTSAPGTPASGTVGVGLSIAMGVAGVAPDQPGHTATLNAGQRKRIKAFLKRARLHPRHSQLNLEGYLLLPIQRIPRYKMLLDNLVTCTPPHPEARDDPLERALEEIAVLASSMNEGKRESESRTKLVQWQARIRGKFISPLVQPHRRLIMDGRMQLVRLVKKVNSRADVANPDGTHAQVEVPCLSSDSNPKQLVAILCNDLLVLCKEPPVSEPNGHVELWAVLRMQTMAQPASIVSGNGLRLVDNKAILYFNTQSTSEALTWQRAINLHIPHSQ